MSRQTETNLRDFFDTVNDLFFVLDCDFNVIEINGSVTRLLGFSKDDLLGKSIFTVYPAECREEADNAFFKILSGDLLSCPIPLTTNDGKRIPVSAIVYYGTWQSEKAIIVIGRNLNDTLLLEEKFLGVFNHDRVMMAMSTFDKGVFIHVNDALLKTLGYSRNEIIGKSSKEISIFNDYNQRAALIEKYSRNERGENCEIIIKTKSGDLLTCLFYIKKLRIQSQECLLTSAVDITEMKKNEDKLKYYLNQQILLATISQKLNNSSDIERNIEDALKLIGEHTGVSRVYIFEDAADGNTTRNTFEWCNAGIKPQKDRLQLVSYDVIPSLKKIIEKDGGIFSRDISELPADLVAEFEPQGIKSILIYPLAGRYKPIGFIGFDECEKNREWPLNETELLKIASGIISNVFERKSITKLLAESELRLKLAIESAKEGLWDWNIATGKVYFNETWCKMLGYEQNEIEPNVKSWEKLVHPEDMPDVMNLLNKHLNSETDYYETVHRVKMKDGGWKWILDHGKVVERGPDNEPLRAVGTHIDVSHQKEMERKLQESIAARDKLFSVISHDLRGPFGTLLHFIERLTDENRNEEELKSIFLPEFKKMSKKTYQLLENLLNWAKCQMNEIKFNPSVFALNSAIDENFQLAAMTASQKNIKLSANGARDFSVFADRDMFNLIIRNLLFNAIKFTPAGGSVNISACSKNEMIEVAISDNGIGIKKEVFENLFNPNIFNSTFGTNNEKGSGLGLVLCSNFVERNGGKIWAETSTDRGSVFTFSVPCAEN